MRALMPALALMITLALPTMAEDTFIEGFPDVPMLSMIRGFEGEPMVFDAPSGTVAEATLAITGTGAKALEAYGESLAALGWKCTAKASGLVCLRDSNRLILSSPNPAEQDGTLTLRLEPSGS